MTLTGKLKIIDDKTKKSKSSSILFRQGSSKNFCINIQRIK